MEKLIAESVGITFSVMFLYIAHKRFLKGEFYEILRWVSYGYVLIAQYKVAEIAEEYILVFEDLFCIMGHVFFLAAVLCIIKSALLVNEFSKVYGFAEVEK